MRIGSLGQGESMSEQRTPDAVDAAKAKLFEPKPKWGRGLTVTVVALAVVVVSLAAALILAFNRITDLKTEVRDLETFVYTGYTPKIDGEDVEAPALCDGRPAVWKDDELRC